MAAAAILDFLNLKFLTFETVSRVELRNHAKFCLNRSNRGRDIVINIAVLPFRNFGGFRPSFLLGGTFRKSAWQRFFFRVKPRHVEKFQKCWFADVGKLSCEKRTEASKFTKIGTWGG